MDAAAPNKSMKHRLVTGFAWVMASRILINFLAFASSIVLARLLVPEDFGLVALAVGLGTVVLALTALPISEALISITDLDEHHLHSAFTLGLIRATLLAVLLVAAAWPAAAIYDDARLVPIMLIQAFNAMLTGFYSPRWPLIQKNLSFGPEFVSGSSSRIIMALSSVLLAYSFGNYWAIVIPLTIVQLVSVGFSHLYAPYRFRLSTRRLNDIWSFSIWMTLGAVLTAITTRLDALLIGGVLGHKAVGYYSYGDEKANLPTRELSGPLVMVLFPGLAAVKDDPARLASGYKRIQRLIFAASLPAGVGFALIADQFVHLLLGDKWAPIIPIMQVIGVALAFENMIVGAIPLAMATGDTRPLFARNVLSFACRTPAVALGLLLFGIPGVLAARVFAVLCNLAIFLTLAKRLANVSVTEQFAGCVRSMLAVIVMAIAVLGFKTTLSPATLAQGLPLLATVAIGGLCYALAHGIIWLLAGRPDGPEAEILAMLATILRKGRAMTARAD